MRRLGAFVLLSLMSGAALCAQEGGLSPEWDIRQTLAVVTADTKRLQPLLDQVNPKGWDAKGATEAYVGQWQAVRNEIGYLARTAGELSKKPESTTFALETYLRLQSVEDMMQSFAVGVRRYQNAAVADLLIGVMDENAKSSQKLRDYVVELVTTKEAELKMAHREAQRCRAELINRPPVEESGRKGQSR